MKHILLAIAIMFGAASMPAVEASAASVTIGENGVTIRDGRSDGYRHHRRHYRDDRRYSYRHHRRPHYRERCRVRTVKTYRHHRVIIRKVRVCR